MKTVLYRAVQCTWGFLPSLNKLRRDKQISYFSFFTEKWANYLGEKVTGRKSMESLVID